MSFTKKQRKDRERILAWLNGEPFRENARSKPAVPELTARQVLETYVHPEVKWMGAYFTPLPMAKALIEGLDIRGDERVLDPCAGIGNLIYYLEGEKGEIGYEYNLEVDCFELCEEFVQVGERLFPFVTWTHGTPFEYIGEIERPICQYDVVVANPPFNTGWGTREAEQMVEGRCSRSEHMFLELVVRVLKPGGQAAIIAPYNYVDGLPKAAREWFDKRAEVVEQRGPLPGEFAQTKIQVMGWYIRKLEEQRVRFAPPPAPFDVREARQLSLGLY